MPLWGYLDESLPEVMEKKIDAAVDNGVDGFIFDWYWFEDGGYRLKCIDQGFLGASNCKKAKFGIMWCNHDPVWVHPAGKYTGCLPLHSADLSLQAFYEGTQYCIDHYMWRDNYLRNSKGELYFCFYVSGRLIKNFGGEEGLRIAIADFRERVRKARLGEVDLSAIFESIPGFAEDITAANQRMVRLGFNSYSTHGLQVRDTLPFPHRAYAESIAANIAAFSDFTEKAALPLHINIYQGRDPSPRTIQSDMYGEYGFPFGRIINDKTPAAFEELCRAAKNFYYEKGTGEYITVYSWNEWTEGGYLEPDCEDGYGYLDALRHVFRQERSGENETVQ